jgi:hypothetical protein
MDRSGVRAPVVTVDDDRLGAAIDRERGRAGRTNDVHRRVVDGRHNWRRAVGFRNHGRVDYGRGLDVDRRPSQGRREVHFLVHGAAAGDSQRGEEHRGQHSGRGTHLVSPFMFLSGRFPVSLTLRRTAFAEPSKKNLEIRSNCCSGAPAGARVPLTSGMTTPYAQRTPAHCCRIAPCQFDFGHASCETLTYPQHGCIDKEHE